jgi:hypothetical protein
VSCCKALNGWAVCNSPSCAARSSARRADAPRVRRAPPDPASRHPAIRRPAAPRCAHAPPTSAPRPKPAAARRSADLRSRVPRLGDHQPCDSIGVTQRSAERHPRAEGPSAHHCRRQPEMVQQRHDISRVLVSRMRRKAAADRSPEAPRITEVDSRAADRRLRQRNQRRVVLQAATVQQHQRRPCPECPSCQRVPPLT